VEKARRTCIAQFSGRNMPRTKLAHRNAANSPTRMFNFD
jgi:hypothetical protein